MIVVAFFIECVCIHRSLDGFLSRHYAESGGRKYPYFCPVCLSRFETKDLRRAHQQNNCIGRNGINQSEEWPHELFRYKFSANSKQYLCPLIGVFDFEAILDDSKIKDDMSEGIDIRPCAKSENPCHRGKCVCDENADHERPRHLMSIHTPVCFSFVMADINGN